ncbi:tail fiber domain-containing protein [Streptococcus pneumoniae]|uniref:tail fiber domain-containing protein n=2 Tax=Streptococcus pneumoniae TaxID=1313 RepID=UPI0010CE7B95|nr:tail fiber domain-containing protein [Streptococcus pneumoniae]MDG7059832.1 tail fiber domain-containing protein [Streptococcus pneumoniae]MDG7087863.1 tail fiber domain-containing protein [Streptococcus pneumoniae]MDG7449856.1 tail fiber domain-containing protein [Streptococcus pneumoniae]MDG7498862.1 tail fiber domain-containing protein [Streptococcus pneumoniae]MDG7600907.1 tail fiber domain-containing protein [Streptococcus pneumoniae]
MDALTRRQFDRAMFAKERTLAIRVGDYASRDIKEASFEYGYIKGDTYKPGGTCAGSGKITFTSIITTFNKLDTLHPEIGLLVGDTYQWVKMGEYFINDIEIDRNRNTTTLELMDGMFKLNREYVTDLHFPAEVREVIQEICLKTGIELANDYFGISAMRYHIEQVPEGKKLSFRDMLSAMTQMIGMSCFFNREGKMEIRDLTESNITINADSYFLHGLTKSEIEYQIAGITCKTDKKSLTVGMKTGRSLELDNVFMTQSALNDLYYKLKNLTYYPYNLNYQGHLLLEVGQWVTIQTNKKETFKVPVLSQSFTFKGGLRGRISADSKAGNDTQYSYEGTITKHIKQQDDIEAKIQAQIEAADKDFDQKVDKIKKDFNDQVELAKARAEEVKRELSDTINQRFNSFDNGPLKETKRKAEEALRNAGASTLLAQEAKRIGLDSVARLEAFKSQTTSAQTALSGDLDALKRTIANDIRPKQAQAEAEIAKQAEALSRTKNELAGASTLLAQEAKRIELDSVARLEAFKSQTTSAQTALSGDLDVLKQTIANDIRPKQAQAEAEIAKQVEALSRTKNELAGVKSAQAMYKETTTRRLSELTNLANGKASKSELTQTAEELASRIASVQASGRNLFLNSLFKQDISKTGIWTTSTYTATIDSESKYLGHKALKIIGLNPSGRDGGNPKVTYPALGQFGKVIPGSTTNQDVTISFYAKANKNGIMLRSRLGNIGYKTGNVTLSTEIKRYVVHIPKGWTNESKQTTNEWLFNFNQEGTVWIWMPKFEISDVDTSYSEAPEDIEGQISTVESTFKQRANSLDAGVRSLTEGLRTKVDISALNVTAENIRQSVKSLETDTQNKLNQKLSQAEFEVRAGSIRQEILNVTKDKASKSELTQTAEELSSKIASVQVGGINLLRNTASLLIGDRSKGCWMSASGGNGRAISVEVLDPPKKMIKNMIRVIENTNGGNKDLTQLVRLRIGEKYTISCYARIASDSPNANVNLLFRSWANNTDLNRKFQKSISHKNWQKYSFTFTADAIENSIQFGQSGAGIIEICAPKIESGTLATDYSEAPEDIEGQISTVESTFKQRANSLDAGVRSLTEGLRTKVDISSLNVTAENIRQSVKSLETDTQNKLNQKLSQAEFEVRAGSIRQEILNATKDKADKTLVVAEAGKLREEFSKMKVGGRNLWIKSKTVGAVIEKLPENHVTGQKECYRLENNSTLTFNLEPDFSSRLYQKVTFSAWIKYENVVQGRNFWNVFNCFKHYLFRKNSETGVQSGPDYATLGMYKGSADWKYITFTYDYSEKTNFDQLKTSLRFNLEGATSGTAWVTGIKVEIGSVATDWSPAPEDADGLITEAKATFERTAQGLRTDLSAIQEYVNKDGQRQEALQRYTREESARQATAVRELVNRDFVGKATYQEDVKGINQRIEAVKTSANKDIASQIASYRQSVDGKFTDISSQITTYKQDVGGQISGLSNRLTSSEQGTTTQISNISNRINSNKQGADNQISNLKTQVATNKDNAERQMGRISDQVSANKANADSQFANVTNQLARKVETTDFQRVKETSKLYERILGNTENGIADKVARMALTNQLFQVEVGKYSVSGPNLIKNSDFKNATNEWGSTQNLGRLVKHSFYHNGQKDLMRLSNATKNENFLYSHRFNLERNTDYVLNFRGFNNSALASYDVYILGRRAGESDGFTIVKKVVSSKKLSTSRCEDVSVTFNSGEMDNAYIRFDNNGSSSGTADLYITEVDLYKGYKPRTWQPHPEDAVADANKKLEATQTKMTLLTGSWAVQNINSAGDIISGINLGANGHNRFVGKLTHITGETLIDRAVIKSAMVDKLKTANFEAGSVTTTILEAEAVTAEKLKVDNALIKKLTATDAFIYELISKRIFSTKVESVISSSTFLEAYQGRIGGFTLGQFDQGGGRWISGVNQFSVGMGNGAGYGVRTAFWANWGNNWNYAGPKAWNVNTDGKMYCRNEVGFYDQVDFSNSSRANFYGNTTFSRSPVFSNGIELGSKDVLGDGWNPKGGRNAVVWWNQVGSGSVKYWMEQKSDRRLKENITDTAVKALDKINRLRMVAFDFIENKKHEEIGLIAQEAETIVPKIVSRDPENPDGYLHIDYTALVPYLIKAIQELNQKIEKMEKTIA